MLSRPDGPAALKHLLNTNHDARTAATAAQEAGDRRVSQPRGRRRRRTPTRRARAGARAFGSARWSRAATSAPRCASLRRSCRSPSRSIATFDRDDPAYVLDVVSVVEAVLDDPRQILYAQQNAAKGAEVARLKSEGVPYEERMERLETITWPTPLSELLDACFEPYRGRHPWVAEGPSPKSILREMLEGGDTFASFIRRYRLDRSEGLLLRYLTDAWRTLDRSLPDDVYTEIAGGRRRVARRADPRHRRHAARRVGTARRQAGARPPRARCRRRSRPPGRRRRGAPPCAPLRSDGWSCWRGAAVRRARRTVRLGRGTAERARWRPTGPSTTPSASTPTPARREYFRLTESPGRWTIEQTLSDPAGDGEWRLVATVDLDVAMAEGAPTLRLEHLGPPELRRRLACGPCGP